MKGGVTSQFIIIGCSCVFPTGLVRLIWGQCRKMAAPVPGIFCLHFCTVEEVEMRRPTLYTVYDSKQVIHATV